MADVLIDMTAMDTPSRQRGIGRYVRGLCDALVRLAPGRGVSLTGLRRLRGGAVLDPSLRYEGDPALRLTSLGYQRHKLERRLLLGAATRQAGARLLHLPDPPGTPLDMRVPRVVSCHDLIPLVLHERYAPPVVGWAMQWARAVVRYRTAERVLASSAWTRRDLIEHVGVPDQRIEVVPLGVDLERFTPEAEPGERERVAELLGFRSPFVLYVGAADWRKNLPDLLVAYGRSPLRGEVPLVLVGPISARQRGQLEAVARRERLTGQVHIRGYVDEALVAPLYRTCLLHVFPSSYEGFGLPVLEAMACGAPTLCSRLSSLAEVAGDAALTVGEPKVEPLADGLARLAGDEALQQALRARGIAHARTFTWERCAEQTLRCYEEMLS